MPSPPSSPPPPHAHDNPTNGLFQNGEWYCNCEPRLKAVVRCVSKDTKNFSRRFWGCPNGEGENRCKMFLWVEDAERRRTEYRRKHGYIEKKQATLPESYTPRKVKQQPEKMPPAQEVVGLEAVAADDASTASSTSRSSYDTTSSSEGEGEEKEPTSRHTPSRTTGNALQPSAMARTSTTQATSSKKKRTSHDEYLEDLTASGAEELVAAEEKSIKTATKRGKQREMLVTPTTVRTTDIENGMPTPSLTLGRPVKKLQYNIPSTGSGSSTSPKRQRLHSPSGEGEGKGEGEGEGSRLFGTDKTIAPSSPPSAAAGEAESLTGEVMGLLQDENIEFATRNAVRQTLKKYEKMARGFEMGRDAARKAAKEAEEQRVRLQTRIDELEQARREVKTQLMGMWDHI
ncbi:hypothetical protein F5Y09DRAFT_242298 [Xylaria sp. FL1042]|nr:hypothetical protein F5Y09DRAFT_242298 [Xylaria sp. FL1042]